MTDRAGLSFLRWAMENGTWLTVITQSLNGTELSREEFQDNIFLRYGIVPLNLPNDCDGCGKMLSMLHAFIVPGARWNLLPPGTLKRRAYTAT